MIGDVGLVIGTFLLFDATGALDFEGVFAAADNVFTTNDGQLVAACLMLLVGAFAKSGQLPLHTWLPDAMEGPTPVSSLIHAATMVTAGVYLIARMYPLFELAPTGRRHRRGDRHGHAGVRRHGRGGGDRPQTGDRLLHDLADRLHDPGRLDRRPTAPGCSTS